MRAPVAVGVICKNCSSCFRDSCPRGRRSAAPWPPIRKVGKDTECPLLSLRVAGEKTVEKASALTFEDTWRVCNSCQYGKGMKIDVGDFMAHCVDCACLSARECLEESRAEALMS